ncbi:MAG: hypothetical protein PF448_05210, partial [Bacteroidales bacterium]|nr:hypothetical protein [Bacteroidales bacterium]
MKFVFAKIIIFAALFCFAEIIFAKDIQVVTSLDDLEDIVNYTWVSNSINRLMPPAKDCVYNNSLGVIAYAADFDTNFIASLTPVVLYNGSNEFLMYPVEVVETNNSFGRIRNYYSAISTNAIILHSNEVSIANYPVSWIENIYGEPPVYLSGSAIQDWYDACDPMRQHVLCDLLPTNSILDYLAMLTNSIGYYVEGTNTNSVLDLYSNCIAVVQCNVQAEDAELYLHAPDDISMLDVYNSTNLLNQYGWNLVATLEHNLDPLRYVAGFDTSSYYSLGNAVLDSDGDGLLDARELKLFGTDPDSADSDADGLSDGEEIFLYRLNPLSSDTDDDGLSDSDECRIGMITAWGYNFYGQCNIPVDLINVIALAAGDGHSLALRSDGTVTAWGQNSLGQCTVPTGLNNVIAIDAHRWHSIALKGDGTVTAWGYNFYGQCNVPADLTDAIAVATGNYHSLALRSDGTVVAWGTNYSGQLDIPTGLDNIIAIAAGFNYNLALHSDGTVTAWGGNNTGQLNVPTELSNVEAIAAGYGHSLALRSNGTVTAWGYNYYGQSTVPVGLSDVLAIKAGFNHSMALKSDGTVVAWGKNSDGESDVPTGVDNAITIAAGDGHSLALINSGLNPCSSDTDGDGLGDGWEVQYSVDPCDSEGDNGADGDPDGDSLTNLEEQQAGTNPKKWDTDGDLLSDSWEVQYGLNPLVANDVLTEDTDQDGLSLFDEYRYVTDPNNPDTDGDGVSDGDEVPHSRGSNPNDPDDYGDPTNCVTMKITVGDPSGSNSERWRFDVFNENKEVVHHVDDDFGTPGSSEYALVKGKEYIYRIKWLATNIESPDYDWRAFINDLSVAGI